MHPRVLQGPAVPRRRVGDPCGAHEQHERDGRAPEGPSGDVLGVRDRDGRPRGHPAVRRVLLEGLDPLDRVSHAPLRDLDRRARHRVPHGPVHDAGGAAHVLRLVSRARASARIASGHDTTPGGTGHSLHTFRLPGNESGNIHATGSSLSQRVHFLFALW